MIPDCQVKPDVDTSHLKWANGYIRDKKPTIIVQLGDMWDMESLSSYDRGKRSAEGKRYRADIEAGNKGLQLLTKGIDTRTYRPKRYILRGNHEYRIERAANDSAYLEGTLDYSLFNDRKLGWRPVPFLRPLWLMGIGFSHYWPRSSNGSVSQLLRGAPSAREQCKRECASTTAGHKQGLDVAIVPAGNRVLRGLVCGSFYLHDESYMGPQGNDYWRGLIMKHEVEDGNYVLNEVSMSWLKKKYG